MEKLNWKPHNQLEKAGLNIVRLLNKQKSQGFFVGGFVRDLFTNEKSDNIDIATDALPDQVENVLELENIPYKQIGKKFGTILAIPDGLQIEITTFRSESRYSDQRHPDHVEFIREYLNDAQRRDFTINAMYFNPVTCELFDPVGGRKDIAAKIVRFVGDPKQRIDEDPLRMLRGVRFASTLSYKLEKNSFAAIKTRAKLIQGVSGERIRQELDKILISSGRTQGLRLLDDTGLLKFIIPEFVELKKVFHNSKHYHLEGDGLTHALLVADAVTIKNLDLIYAALFHDVGKITTGKTTVKGDEKVISFHGHNKVSEEIFRRFAKRIKFSRKSVERILWLISEHDHKSEYLESTPSKRLKLAIHPDFELLLDLWQADINGNISTEENNWYRAPRWEAYELGKRDINKIRSKKAKSEKFSSGEFIIRQTGLKPGRQIGELSEKIKIKILLGEIQTENDAKKFLKKFTKIS